MLMLLYERLGSSTLASDEMPTGLIMSINKKNPKPDGENEWVAEPAVFSNGDEVSQILGGVHLTALEILSKS